MADDTGWCLSKSALLRHCWGSTKRGMLLCQEQMMNWAWGCSLGFVPPQLRTQPSPAPRRSVPRALQSWQESHVLQPKRQLREEGNVRLDGG